MGYSVDFRERAVAYRMEGHTIKETAEVFAIGKDTVRVWTKKYKETGTLQNKPLQRGFKKIDPEKLKKYVEEHPDEILEEIAEQFGCSEEGIRKVLKRNGITRKKDNTLQRTKQEKSRGILRKDKKYPC